MLAVLLDNGSLDADADGLTVAVSNTGCGIPPESLSRIFDRFYRVDSSRDRKTGEYGLGLAIAQQIARVHHEQLEASIVLGEGSTFRLRLPKNGSTPG